MARRRRLLSGGSLTTLIAAATVVFVSAGCGSGGVLDSRSVDLPAVIQDTTAGAEYRESEEVCGRSGPTRWYRFAQAEKGRVQVRFHAGGDLEAAVCALEEGPSGLAAVSKSKADDLGYASFDFDGNEETTYYVAVTQDPESEPGGFTLNVDGIPRPANDERETATPVSSLPATLSGSTAGATHDDRDPSCVEGNPTVWYRLGSVRSPRVVVRLQAERGTETAACVFQKVRSHLRLLDDDETDERGQASVALETDPKATYYVAVYRPTKDSGRFSLVAQQPEEPPVVPGTPMRWNRGPGTLHPLANPQDAWAVTMQKGKTYRFALVTSPDDCVDMTVFTPRAHNFRTGPVAAEFDCVDTEFFAPGPDGGGTYPVLLTLDGEETAYQLYVHQVEPDDSGPGVVIESGSSTVGFVSPADPLDLYRFDVPGTSSVEIALSSKRYVEAELKNSLGRHVRMLPPNTTTTRVLDAGTYYVAMSPDEDPTQYTLRLRVRFVTATYLTVEASSSVTVGPEDSVYLQTTTVPYPGAGVTKVQADFFDVATGSWVFRELWEVQPGTGIAFTPGAVGRWRVRATFFANDVASMSRTRYCTITVSSL